MSAVLRRILYLGVFTFVVVIVILYAAGYRWYHNALVKTSIVAFVSHVSDIQLFFDDQKVANNLPFQITSVLPGVHTVRIEKAGSLTWTKTVLVDQNTVTRIDHVLLVPSSLSWRTILEDAPTLSLNPTKDRMAVLNAKNGVVSFLQVGNEQETFLSSYNLFQGTVLRTGWIHDDLFLIVFTDGTFQQFNLAEKTVFTAPLPSTVQAVLSDAIFNDGFFVRSLDGVLQEIVFKEGIWNFESVSVPSWASVTDGFFVTSTFFYIQKGNALWQMSRSKEHVLRLLPFVVDASKNWHVWEKRDGSMTVLSLKDAPTILFIDSSAVVHFIPVNGFLNTVSFIDKGVLFTVDGDVFMIDQSVSFDPLFVTRFSHTITAASWYDDGFHVLILDGDILMLCERDGANCTNIQTNVQNFLVADDAYTIFVYTVNNAIQALTFTLEKSFFSF